MPVSAPASILHAGQRVPVPAAGLSVGRSEENDLVVATEQASRRHARIEALDRGYMLTDLGSRNGTLLNGERLAGETRPLADGDAIDVGGELLRFLSGQETRMASRELPVIGTQTVEFSGERLTVGRDRSNDVVLEDPNVSRFHAEVAMHGEAVELTDLGSRNGTRLDGRIVERATLTAGSEIGVGPFRLVFDGSSFLARDDRGALRLDARNVEVDVKGKTILRRTSLSVTPGELVALIGESGSGKSTLMKALAGVTPPTAGAITVNGEPVASRLTDIGYVPQDEIVHGRLSVTEALRYAARLRLPADSTEDDIDATVERVLSELGLEEHRETRIEALSGGQRKRAGVAAELLNRPSLLLLDEPTTGLDPGLESRMMQLLRRLADNSRGVAVITHATKNLGLCDKVAVMGRGGELSFYGRPPHALEFFGVEEYDGIYTALDEKPSAEWRTLFESRANGAGQGTAETAAMPAPARAAAKRRRRRTGPHTRVLIQRYLKLFLRDRRNLLILLGQVPLLALAIAGLFEADVFSFGGEPNTAAQILFLLITTAIWLGSIDASREVIKERSVASREAAVGVRLRAYLVSKLTVLFALAVVQTLLLAAIVLLLRPLHEPAGVYLELIGILLATGLVAVCMGLLVSAAVRTEDQATSFIPLVLIPQLLFSGAIVAVERMSEPVKSISALVFSQWSFAGAGTSIDMNARIAADRAFARVSDYGPSFFDVPAGTTLLILAAFLAAFLAATTLLLRSRL